ncbi:MAG TPA: hypothetical protein VKV35_02460 [Streptosporangiaceae bacterium]|nr:hypothetical protein [Streptosporangiaceae bacterium]
MTGTFARRDRLRDELAARFPGWRIWYVPHYDGSRSWTVWCAQPHPSLAEDTPEQLAGAIEQARPGEPPGAPQATVLVPGGDGGPRR